MSFHQRADTLVIGAISLWVLIMIAIPIALLMFGDAAREVCVLAGVLSQTFAVCIVLFRISGAKSILFSILPIILLGWMVEYIGSNTGIPFGNYEYTRTLQPQLGGVPLIIPVAWLMMIPPAWSIGFILVREREDVAAIWWRFVRAGIAAAAFTAWDLFLDPQMVQWGYWKWDMRGEYFGIPAINFLGWFLVSFVLSILLMPKRIAILPLFSIYCITWFLQAIGQFFFWKLPGPAIFGFFGMGSVILIAVLSSRKWTLQHKT